MLIQSLFVSCVHVRMLWSCILGAAFYWVETQECHTISTVNTISLSSFRRRRKHLLRGITFNNLKQVLHSYIQESQVNTGTISLRVWDLLQSVWNKTLAVVKFVGNSKTELDTSDFWLDQSAACSQLSFRPAAHLWAKTLCSNVQQHSSLNCRWSCRYYLTKKSCRCCFEIFFFYSIIQEPGIVGVQVLISIFLHCCCKLTSRTHKHQPNT